MFDGGIQGILILREGGDFYAFDRECPLKSSVCQPIIMYKAINSVANTNYAYDPGCKSMYTVVDGSGTHYSGPSNINLITYQAVYDGVQYLHIYN